jgi:hypothetical protein
MATARLVKDPARFFIRKDVQDILVKVTGFDLNRIFKTSFNPHLKDSEIQLLTESQLQKVSKST